MTLEMLENGRFVYEKLPKPFHSHESWKSRVLTINPVEKLAREHSWIKADIMVEEFTIKTSVSSWAENT